MDMTSHTDTKRNQELYCRLCGHKDSPAYCSQCGLPLDEHIPASLLRYVWYRLRMLLAYIPRLAITWLLLLVRPALFFETLNRPGVGIHEIDVLGNKAKYREFNMMRLPISPQDYLLFVIILLASTNLVAMSYVEENVRSKIPSYIPVVFVEFLMTFVAPLFAELVLVSLLFLAYHTFRILLGLKSSIVFTEWFIFSSSQILFSMMLVIGVLDAFGIGDSASNVFLVLSFFTLSVYYFLYIPILLRHAPSLKAAPHRIVMSYCMMVVLSGCVFYAIHWTIEGIEKAIDSEVLLLLGY